jgi:peroxiredoxin
MRKLFISALLLFAAFLAGCEDGKESLKGKEIDFSLNDLGGREVRLSDYRGKVVLLEFWATWCPPCIMAIPDLNDINSKFKGRDFALLAVSIAERKELVREFAEEHGINYTVLLDHKEVNSQFGVMTIPTTFIIGKNGGIVAKHLGFVPGLAELLSEEIERLL